MLRGRMIVVNVLLLLALAGSYWSRQIDSAVSRQGDFLKTLSIPYHGWATTDTPLSQSDLATLMPDSYLVRTYRSPAGREVQLAVIAGHRKQSIHTPAFCMAGGGWETLSERTAALSLGGRTIPVTRELMTNEHIQIELTYFFTDGSYCSPSLVDFQTVELFKRFRRRIPMGALVRVIVPVTSTPERAVALSDQFSQATVPTVMRSLSHTQLSLR